MDLFDNNNDEESDNGFIKVQYKKRKKRRMNIKENNDVNKISRMNKHEDTFEFLKRKIQIILYNNNSDINDLKNIINVHFKSDYKTIWIQALIIILKEYQGKESAQRIFWKFNNDIIKSENKNYKINKDELWKPYKIYVPYNIVCWWDSKQKDYHQNLFKVIKRLHQLEFNIFEKNKDEETAIMSLYENKNLSTYDKNFIYDLLVNITDKQLSDLVNDICQEWQNQILKETEIVINNELNYKLKFCFIKNLKLSSEILIKFLLNRPVNDNKLKYETEINVLIGNIVNCFQNLDNNNPPKEYQRFFQNNDIDKKKILEDFYIRFLGEGWFNPTFKEIFAIILGLFLSHGYFEEFINKTLLPFFDKNTDNNYILELSYDERIIFIIRFLVHCDYKEKYMDLLKEIDWKLSENETLLFKTFFENFEK